MWSRSGDSGRGMWMPPNLGRRACSCIARRFERFGTHRALPPLALVGGFVGPSSPWPSPMNQLLLASLASLGATLA